MLVTAFNPSTQDLEKSYLSAYADQGATSLTIQNNQRFANNKRLLIGRMGDERSEIVTCSAVTGNTGITVSATKFPHNQDDPVYILDWDQVRFYRATAIDGTYSLLATTDLDVDNAKRQTPYDDTTGLSTHFYKVKYYHSISLTESDFSDPIQATGYAENSVGEVIDEVVRRVRDTGFTVLGIDEYIDIANEVNKDLRTQSHRPYRWQKTSQKISTVAGQNWVALPTNLQKFNYVDYDYTVGGQTQNYQIREPLSLEDWSRRHEGSTSTALQDDRLRDVAIDEATNRLYLGPTPKTAGTNVIEVHYWRVIPRLTGLGSVFITPNNLIYRYKMMAEHYAARSESDKQWARLADRYENKYGNEVVKMQRDNRLDTGTPRAFKPIPGYRRRYTL